MDYNLHPAGCPAGHPLRGCSLRHPASAVRPTPEWRERGLAAM